MQKPNITQYDASTGQLTEREMTEQEYADLIESGWKFNEETKQE